jgi:hypothetical protein
MTKVRSLASDKANVIVGLRNGDFYFNRHKIKVHCVAHCMALAAAYAYVYFDEFRCTIKHTHL